ncbi:hypothetical protein [Allorhizocola rhizosphaerae]|uniref:hypothetical protein n=1 Tax=Allorhizocola rhizosphaerae TaxID=1872709 RepID=UPI0013C2DA93|nr:hypothetical protein [Allorhizocola rhizosphaerae]
MDPEVMCRRGQDYEREQEYELALADYRAALGDARVDRLAALDGIARCERALGSSEDWDT